MMEAKAKAVLEVVVVFSLTLLLVALLGTSPIGQWERTVTKRFFLEYVVIIAVPLLVLLVSRRNLADCGISLGNLRYHLDIAVTAFLPTAISYMPLMYWNHQRWDGALIMAVVKIVLLFAIVRLLRNKPTATQQGVLAALSLVWLASPLAATPTVCNGLSALVFYIFFLGLGEELLFRGYIQSRLNAAFGKPFRFYGVSWGWGLVITALLFGAMHVLNVGSLALGRWQITWWWGLWTFFAAFVSGYIREKTGSIVAPAILHGLPQALFAAFTGA
jgi:membrane protease YdiL (CAAX protease family)